jgi:ATP-dependent Clp protease ATP-binding subunit ClpC
MQFEKATQQTIIRCPLCQGVDPALFSHCRVCQGMRVGFVDGDQFVYFKRPFTTYDTSTRRALPYLHTFERFGAVATALLTGGLFVWSLYQRDELSLSGLFRIFETPIASDSLLYLSLASWCFLIYRATALRHVKKFFRYQHKQDAVKPLTATTWDDIRALSHRTKKDLGVCASTEFDTALDRAYVWAKKTGSQAVLPEHICLALLSDASIRSLCIRLQISPNTLQAAILKQLKSTASTDTSPQLDDTFYNMVFCAYRDAKENKLYRVGATELFIACIEQSEGLQEMLYDLDVDAVMVHNMLSWIRMNETIRLRNQEMHTIGSTRNKYGLDRAMTAVATPYLNSFSTDITVSAQYGQLEATVARDKEIDEVFRIIDAGKQSVVLVGDRGVGKTAIINGIAQRMVAEDIPKRLQDKRLVQLSISTLLAGTTVSGAQERLLRIMHEVRRAGNIMLFIPNIHDLIGGSTISGGEGMDVSEVLAETLSAGNFLTFATTTTDGYNRHMLNSEVGQLFSKVVVEEMDETQAIQALESKVAMVEYRQRVFFAYSALQKAVEYATKFLHDQRLPESALHIIAEAASAVRSSKGQHALVTDEDIAGIVGQKTGIPVSSLSDDESTKLLHLEEVMHTRVIGQTEAVALVANALRRARANVRSSGRPIANFLFLGPTGVGKTELAKTIAEVYFGGEERMVRLDMSEYQDTASVYRLIGQPGMQGSGILTEAVRQKPFSLVLLDELEKAHKDVLNIFLQVFDDGRLTDSTGRVIDFTNTIVIATSNAGTAYVQEQTAAGVDLEAIKQALLSKELRDYYRPEFLNRFDSIVLFRPLTRDNIKQVASLMLRSIGKTLETDQGVTLEVTDAALESLAEVGFDPQFGARPMRRAIQDTVQNNLAELILEKKLQRRDVVVLGDGLKMVVKRS